MDVNQEIERYLAELSEPKRGEMAALHAMAEQLFSDSQRWFFSGVGENGKVVSNPSIGYGSYIMRHADRSTRKFYRVGISSNKGGISVYLMGLPDKQFLVEQFGATIGKATISAYCIKFKTIRDVNLDVIRSAMQAAITLVTED